MTAALQLTQQSNPLAQTFRVTEPGGSVITGIGLYFASAPASSDLQLPISVELRPVSEGGNPSSTRYIPGSRVTASAAAIRAVASTTFGSGTEYKFTFIEPVYIASNTEVAVVVSTNAKVGQYKMWVGTQGEHVAGSTTELISHQLNAGVFFQSSNGTTWSKDQYTDVAFRVYRAVFKSTGNTAYLIADAPPAKRLTENEFADRLVKYPGDPLSFTAGSSIVDVIHPAHGFIVGDKVKLMSDSDGFDSADTINGVAGSSLLGTKTITAADAYGYSFDCGTNATATVRAGGTSMLATEQYVIDQFVLGIPAKTPPYTRIYAGGDLTTTTSLAGNETAYTKSTNIAMPIGTPVQMKDPHVIASIAQENESTKLNGNPSTIVKVGMDTTSKYVAPYFNIHAANIKTHANFIDYQDSAGTPLSNRNAMSTTGLVSEAQPDGGTTASKHISIPYTLETTASSIRIIVDAKRPSGSDFSIWYRTNQSSSGLISNLGWTEFSKTINPPNSSNYSQRGSHEDFKQYEFNAYDIPDFDEYQIKITMHSTKSTNVPVFKNLRTIATA